ncbi:SRPBCC family protein [Streptomyces sp. NPDC059506]|uniref:SRPBCC family protein n=1 Tax=Streptomyces sp. NPDC059506 TaxID=3347751 RepID=UPI0036A6FF71
MPTVSTSVVVPRPADEVFDFLADARNLALWSSGVDRVASEHVRPGRDAEYAFRFPGRHRDSVLVCSTYLPPEAIAFRGRRMWTPLGTQVPEYAFRLVPHAEGTEVVMSVTCVLHGGLALMVPVVAMAWRRDLPVDAARLREAVMGDRAPAALPAAATGPPAPPAPPAPAAGSVRGTGQEPLLPPVPRAKRRRRGGDVPDAPAVA